MAGLRPTEADVRMGARLHEARRAAGLTQRTVAAAIGVSAAQLQKYERGVNRLSATSLPIIAELTGKPVAWFFGEEPVVRIPAANLSAAQAREALCAAAEVFFEAKHREGALSGASVVAFIGEAA